MVTFLFLIFNVRGEVNSLLMMMMIDKYKMAKCVEPWVNLSYHTIINIINKEEPLLAAGHQCHSISFFVMFYSYSFGLTN